MIDYLIPILIITFLILLNGLFVAAEFALVAAPKPVTTSPASKSPVAANSGQKGMDAKPVNIDAGNKGAQGRATPKYGDMNATTKPDVKPATKPELAQASGVNTKSVID